MTSLPPVTSKLTSWTNWAMCGSMCAHFAGYELIRSSSVTLLTGYVGSEGLNLSITAGFPLSAIALWMVHFWSRNYGVRHTLRLSHLFTVAVAACVLLCSSTFTIGGYCSSIGIIAFYCFREIYVGVIATQLWSFVRVPYDTLIRFAGMVSVASVLGSFCVEFLVKFGGVTVLLATGIAMQLLAWGLSELSFVCDGAKEVSTDAEAPKRETRGADSKSLSFYENCLALLGSNKTLQLLFVEAIVHQACSNLLNVMFYDGLRRYLDDDKSRAVLIGRFFAAVNFVSCVLQCLIMPQLMSPKNVPALLCLVPIGVLISTSFGYAHQSLFTVMLGFGILKVLEYSVMTSAMELIYMPMGHEVRYLGKELIRFFGHRLGKSGTSLLLSAASAHFQPSLQTQTIWSGTLAAVWGASMYLLSSHLQSPEHLKAEEAAMATRVRARSKSRGESLGQDPNTKSTESPKINTKPSLEDLQQLSSPLQSPSPSPLEDEVIAREEEWTKEGEEETDTASLSSDQTDDSDVGSDKISFSSGMEPYVFVRVNSAPLPHETLRQRKCADSE